MRRDVWLMVIGCFGLMACGTKEPDAAGREPERPLPPRAAGLSEARVNRVAVPDELLAGFATRPPGAVPASEAGDSLAVTTFAQAMALLDERPAWEGRYAPALFGRHPAEKYLAGMTFVLDPGHGGKSLEVDGYKTGPTGLREAAVNLRVCLLLRRLLEDAGAVVVMTRETETSAIADDRLRDTLEKRAALANQTIAPWLNPDPPAAGNTTRRPPASGAGAGDPFGASSGGRGGLFLSVHHNASSSPASNYTSVWFHADPDTQQVSLDAGKAIGHALGRHLKNQVGKTSVLMNDKQMFASGFKLLRLTRVPAVLLELGFFTHPVEEQRLKDGEYNLRAAYAIYEGLCEYAYGGRPTQRVPTATLAADKRSATISIQLDDGLPATWWGSQQPRVLASTIQVQIADQPVPHAFDPKTKRLTVEVGLSGDWQSLPARTSLTVRFQNLYKHSNWPQRYDLVIDGDRVAIELTR